MTIDKLLNEEVREYDLRMAIYRERMMLAMYSKKQKKYAEHFERLIKLKRHYRTMYGEFK